MGLGVRLCHTIRFFFVLGSSRHVGCGKIMGMILDIIIVPQSKKSIWEHRKADWEGRPTCPSKFVAALMHRVNSAHSSHDD